MKVLVTGAGGFIGSHVVEALTAAGNEVRALVRYNGRGDWGHLGACSIDCLQAVDVRQGDVADATLVRDLVDGCDVVLHLAALIGIPYSYAAPGSYASTNILGTLNVLEACRAARTKRVVVTSTSEVYGTAQYAPIDEDHPLQAQSPYAATKIAADKLAESYYRSFDLPVVILRPFNTYGPRQSARAVIPTVIAQALSGCDEIRLGNLLPERDLTFVEDTAHAFVLAATAPDIEGEVIHFGQGAAISVGDLAAKCLMIVGSSAQIAETAERQRPDKSEVGLLMCNAAKARKLLGWRPQVTLDEGLARVRDYVAAHLDHYRIAEYVI